MKHLRMCMVCRERKEKDELIRVVKKSSGEIALDKCGKADGRGAYVCKSAKCVNEVERRRCLERTFSCKIEKSVYEEIVSLMEVAEDEC